MLILVILRGMFLFPLRRQNKAALQNKTETNEKNLKQSRFGDVGVSKNVFSVTSLPTIQDSALLKLMQCLYTLWLWLWSGLLLKDVIQAFIIVCQ